MKKTIGALLFGCALTLHGAVLREGAWSLPVDGLRARLVVETPREISGVSSPSLYVEFQNLTRSAFPRRLYMPPFARQFEWELRDRQGHVIPSQGMAISGIGVPCWLLLPPDSRLLFFISDVNVLPGIVSAISSVPVPQFGSPPATAPKGIDLYAGFRCWPIRHNWTESFFLSASFKSAASEDGAKEEREVTERTVVWAGTITLPPVELPVQKTADQSPEPPPTAIAPPAQESTR